MALRVAGDIMNAKLRIAQAMRSAGFIHAANSMEAGSTYVDDFDQKHREWSNYLSGHNRFWSPAEKKWFEAPAKLTERRIP